MSPRCPLDGNPGKKVSALTLRSLLQPERAGGIWGREWFYCDRPDCEAVYFSPDGTVLGKDALKVRIGQKEKKAPRPVCYCFGHTVEEIEDEVAKTGSSRAPDEIVEKCRQGLDRCEETNPKGSCCQGDVRKVVKEAHARPAWKAPDGPSADSDPSENPARCKPAPTGIAEKGKDFKTDRRLLLTAGGSLLAAVLSSACCWLPLLLLAFGATAAGAAAFFEAYRPLFLLGAGPLLAVGFFLNYLRKTVCEPGSACASPSPKLRRFNRSLLWVTAVFVAAFALFPNDLGLILAAPRNDKTQSRFAEAQTLEFGIRGMTCEGCAEIVRRALSNVPGVLQAEVSYEMKKATLKVDRSAPPKPAALDQAVEKAGYKAELDARE